MFFLSFFILGNFVDSFGILVGGYGYENKIKSIFFSKFGRLGGGKD